MRPRFSGLLITAFGTPSVYAQHQFGFSERQHPEIHQTVLFVPRDLFEANRRVPLKRRGDVWDADHRDTFLGGLSQFSHLRLEVRHIKYLTSVLGWLLLQGDLSGSVLRPVRLDKAEKRPAVMLVDYRVPAPCA